MKKKRILKIAVDISMTVMLLFLMTYELIGAVTHEWLGIGMFLLFVLHHFLNNKWSRNIFKGRYSPLRILQTVLVIGIFLTMAGSMLSGMILSEYALSFLPIKGGRDFAGSIHMISAYWGFVLMSLHLGVHWSMILGKIKKIAKRSYASIKYLLRITGIMLAGYGMYAFVRRDIWDYMTLKNHFMIWDFGEPLIYVVFDYLAIMILFVAVSFYFQRLLIRRSKD